ncbi:hypothetical protein HMPREF3228_00064 [Streptococcus mitis]|uniref:Uncharacterized protein n=1 Tax=Streptococcus mitis TaxID=28037 RepID=A0A133S3H9_STRMT|nr:hypothetical protein HMPREF3228_00064 [Streptococcus mitis]
MTWFEFDFRRVSNKKKRLHQSCSLFAVLKMKRQTQFKNPPLSKD